MRDWGIIWTHDLCRHAKEVAVEIDRKNCRNCHENREEGKGLEGKGHGSDKGPLTVPLGVSGRSGSHPLRLVSTSYDLPVSCHGRGRGFECGADGQIGQGPSKSEGQPSHSSSLPEVR